MASSENTLGDPIPAFTEHAISVSLPTWADNVGYEEGEARVINAMQSGYPRFFIQLNIRKVNSLFSTSAVSHATSHVAFRPLRTKVRHTLRELSTLPLPQIRRRVPRIPRRTRRPRPRRTALHLRPPLHLPRALPSRQGQHRQAILAAHRPGHLEPAGHAMPRSPRSRLVTTHVAPPQARSAPALRVLQARARTAVVVRRRRGAARDGPVRVPRAALRTEFGRWGGGAGEGRAAPPYCGRARARRERRLWRGRGGGRAERARGRGDGARRVPLPDRHDCDLVRASTRAGRQGCEKERLLWVRNCLCSLDSLS